jgi:hypothetical protein
MAERLGLSFGVAEAPGRFLGPQSQEGGSDSGSAYSLTSSRQGDYGVQSNYTPKYTRPQEGGTARLRARQRRASCFRSGWRVVPSGPSGPAGCYRQAGNLASDGPDPREQSRATTGTPPPPAVCCRSGSRHQHQDTGARRGRGRLPESVRGPCWSQEQDVAYRLLAFAGGKQQLEGAGRSVDVGQRRLDVLELGLLERRDDAR